MNTTKIVKDVNKEAFKSIISKYKGNIKASPHALFHLSDSQRNVFNEKDLVKFLLNEKPESIGLQRNGRYAVFYKRKNYYLRIILEVKPSQIEIVTFINTETIPIMKRLKNE